MLWKSQNGRWGVEVVDPRIEAGRDSLVYHGHLVVSGSAARQGTAAGVEVVRVDPAGPGLVVVCTVAGAKPVHGCAVVAQSSLQGGKEVAVMQAEPGAVWRTSGYKARSPAVWTLRDGQPKRLEGAEALEAVRPREPAPAPAPPAESVGRVYVGNAFSLGMLSELGGMLEVTPSDAATVAQALREGAVSVVGHASTAAVFGSLLGCSCAENRATVSLQQGDTLYVGQYTGPRLPEGATTLPEGAAIRWLEVTLHPGTPTRRTRTEVHVGPGGTAVGTWQE